MAYQTENLKTSKDRSYSEPKRIACNQLKCALTLKETGVVIFMPYLADYEF
jgi:hypothetical protein